ncbi:MAG: hypothetical protein KKI09_13335 [Spirochaetes bacterium]|nr:hypothetical protein [Spirochaetota bacterium]MBU0956407.1 hypothetical protein [Spirochaetota bacterium]
MTRALRIMVPLIIILASIAALAGLWPADGEPFSWTTLRGEQLEINGRGLYYFDSVSSAAQMQANDLITLLLGVPLLVVSYILSWKNSLRGKILLAGTLGFILYTYITMSMGAQFNQLFLLYVALFGLSLFSLILACIQVKPEELRQRIKDRFPRRRIVGILLFAALFILVAWVSRILAAYKPGAVPQLENVTSMFIQAMDLAIIVPLCLISAMLLIKGQAWGFLLSAFSLVKFSTLGIAVATMGLNMARVGAAPALAELIIFLLMALAGCLATVALFRSIK